MLTIELKAVKTTRGKYHLHNDEEPAKSMRGTPAPVGSTWENLSAYGTSDAPTSNAQFYNDPQKLDHKLR